MAYGIRSLPKGRFWAENLDSWAICEVIMAEHSSGSRSLVARLIGCRFFRLLGAGSSLVILPAGSALLHGKSSSQTIASFAEP